MTRRSLSGVALLIALSLAVPTPAMAVAPAKKKAKRGTLEVVVKGLPGRKVLVTVEGPKNFGQTKRTNKGFTLKKMRKGAYKVSGQNRQEERAVLLQQ